MSNKLNIMLGGICFPRAFLICRKKRMNKRLHFSATDSKKGNLSEPRLFLYSVTAVSTLIMNHVSHLPVGVAQQFF